jgi:SAM-dependent methyltransferase
MTSHDAFQAAQDRQWEAADPAHFRWTTEDPAFAPVEDALLGPWLADLPSPCLEIGCGEGTNLARLVRRGRLVFGVDRYRAKASFAARAIPAARVAAADALALPFRDGVFAGVLIRDLLHHLPDPRRATAEAARVLAPGGLLVVLEPNGRNPLVALQARLVPAEAALRTFTPASVLAALAGLPLEPEETAMAQGLPLRRLLLHYRFGLPALGRPRLAARALEGLERIGARLLPRSRWSYTVVRARRRCR